MYLFINKCTTQTPEVEHLATYTGKVVVVCLLLSSPPNCGHDSPFTLHRKISSYLFQKDQSKNIHFIYSTISWDTAERTCQEKGLHLLSITTPDVQQSILKEIQSQIQRIGRHLMGDLLLIGLRFNKKVWFLHKRVAATFLIQH